MIISIDTENAFDKIQHSFIIQTKTFQKLGIEEPYLTNVTYDKPIANNIVNQEKLKHFL